MIKVYFYFLILFQNNKFVYFTIFITFFVDILK